MCRMCNGGPPQEFGELYWREDCVSEFDLCAVHSLRDTVFAEVSRAPVFGILSLVCGTIRLGLRPRYVP